MPSFFYHVAFDLHPPIIPHGATSLKQASAQENAQEAGTPNPTSEAKGTRVSSKTAPVCGNREPTSQSGVCGPFTSTGWPTEDRRYDRIKVQNIEMLPTATRSKRGGHEEAKGQIEKGIVAGHGGLATKGRFEPLDRDEEDLGWGVIRLFRDAEETPGLYDETVLNKTKGVRGFTRKGHLEEPRFRDDDCNTLCILAVPSYLTPSDFLGFVGEKTRDEVSHFRMIRTERGNRYMVLMKFRNGKKAREWRKEWNGKQFDSMEVISTAIACRSPVTDKLASARELPCRLRQVYRIQDTRRCHPRIVSRYEQ